jgi:ribosomal protein S18 acetylase RimI-like enzyme
MPPQPENDEPQGTAGLIVRRMTPDDVQAVREVARETWNDAYRDIIPELERAVSVERAYTRKVLERRMAGGAFLVAEWRDEVVGFADLSSRSDEPREVELAALYVLPSMQGRGVGSRLLDEGIRMFPAARSVVLRVLRENAAARRFYEARGFTPVGEHPWWLWSGGVVYELEMVREVAVRT